ncbi:MAG: dihydroorotase [Oscillospiraceae bacterium]
MSILLTGGNVYRDCVFKRLDIAVRGNSIVDLSPNISPVGFDIVLQVNNLFIIPGLVDVHVHLRQPGFCYKETIASGTAAAARGGFTAVCSMPNLNPVPDCLESLRVQLAAIELDAHCGVFPFGAITRGRSGDGTLSDMEAMAPFVAGFSDDGCGVQSDVLMEKAMLAAKRQGKPIVAHCEDNSLLTKDWCLNESDFAKSHKLAAIDSKSEWKQLERDLKLVAKTGCQYHACHISSRESVELIRKAKAEGLPVTCETAPHYLVFCSDDLCDDGRFKMNPPLRFAADRQALLCGIADGTIDVIATDHAPHSDFEKSCGLADSAFGVVGLETAFVSMYTELVRKNIISLETLIDKMSLAPRRIFGLRGGNLKEGESADITVLDLNCNGTISSGSFLSKGHSTPFDNMEICADIAYTICEGRITWDKSLQKSL